MGILVLNGSRIVLSGDTISLGGPDPAPGTDKLPQVIMAATMGKMMCR